MTDEEFAAGVDDIIATERGHRAHRSLDTLWTQYAREKGGVIAAATDKWMATIEGHHADGEPYPLRVRDPWTRQEANQCWALHQEGKTYRQIGNTIGRSKESVKAKMEDLRIEYG